MKKFSSKGNALSISESRNQLLLQMDGINKLTFKRMWILSKIFYGDFPESNWIFLEKLSRKTKVSTSLLSQILYGTKKFRGLDYYKLISKSQSQANEKSYRNSILPDFKPWIIFSVLMPYSTPNAIIEILKKMPIKNIESLIDSLDFLARQIENPLIRFLIFDPRIFEKMKELGHINSIQIFYWNFHSFRILVENTKKEIENLINHKAWEKERKDIKIWFSNEEKYRKEIANLEEEHRLKFDKKDNLIHVIVPPKTEPLNLKEEFNYIFENFLKVYRIGAFEPFPHIIRFEKFDTEKKNELMKLLEGSSSMNDFIISFLINVQQSQRHFNNISNLFSSELRKRIIDF